MIRKNTHKPFYRTVVPEALKEAWTHRKLWILSIFALFLHTGGIFDALLKAVRDLRGMSQWLAAPVGPDAVRLAMEGSLVGTGLVLFLEQWVLGLLVGLGLLALSLLSQAGLAYGLGGLVRGRMPNLRECLVAGRTYLPGVALLNLITIGIPFAFKVLVAWLLLLATSQASIALTVTYVVAGLFFVALAIAATAVHFFSLYAIVLQEASLGEALKRSLVMLRRGWLAILEVGFVLFGVGVLIFVCGALLTVLALIPFALLFTVTAVLGSEALSLILLGSAIGVGCALVLTIGAVATQFQYAVWHRLFLKLGEGGLVAKLHRLYHTLVKPA
jgi:hypothetical protein